jgi:hypothetical protein
LGAGVPKKSTIVTRLKEIDPQDFENLAYDLLFVSGMRNLRWRTPGADGGRDLEGEFVSIDFAGHHNTQKWYIECKRYAKSLDWPTVHQKLAIADNHQADFLLFITTSNFSPDCRDEVDRHNARGGVTQLRIWPYFVLENLLTINGQVALKYGLRNVTQKFETDFKSIVLEISKLAQSAYGAVTFGVDASARIELLAAFTELLSTRAKDAEHFGRFVKTRFNASRDSYDWCEPYPLSAAEFDQTSLRAALAAIRTISGRGRVQCSLPDSRTVVIQDLPQTDSLRSKGDRSRSENGWIAMSFRDRIHQSFDFPVQLPKLLLEALPFCL